MTAPLDAIYVEVHGAFRRHAWTSGESRHEDAFSAFVSRSALMRWSASAGARGGGRDLWGMNDAALEEPVDGRGRVAWVQVVTTAEPPAVVPVVATLGAAVNRFGLLELDAIEVYVPARPGSDGLGPLVSGLNWFELSDVAARCEVRVLVDRPAAVDGLLEALEQINTGPFEFRSIEVDVEGDARARVSALGDEWLGGGHWSAKLTVSAPEPSFDALGWIAALVAEAVAWTGSAPGATLVRLELGNSAPA